jgi:3-hydroxyisobutyrate dehydrogenase-like beta-hydroxyacid dehydrogenase
MDKSPIGLVGIGLLGSALAERMLAAGLQVFGFDVDGSRGTRLKELGGQFAAAPSEVTASCEQIVLCLPDSNVVASVLSAMGETISASALVIDATTGDPDSMAMLAGQLAERGIGYIDATIAGSSEQVRHGEAVVIVGGDDRDVRRAEPILTSWSDRRLHVGPAGSGARLKLVVNLVLGLNRAVLAEGLSLAKACGIDPATALDVLKATPAYSKVMDTKGPKMIAREYAPQARLAQHAKDVRLIRELALKYGALTPLSEVHAALLQTAIALGYANADNSAVIEAFQARVVSG